MADCGGGGCGGDCIASARERQFKKNERFFALEAGDLNELVFFCVCEGQKMAVDCRRRIW